MGVHPLRLAAAIATAAALLFLLPAAPALAGACPYCTNPGDCPGGFCVTWIGAHPCGDNAQICCPSPGCAIDASGRPSCEAAGTCTVLGGGGTDAAAPGTDAAPPGTDAAPPGTDAAAPGTDAAPPGTDAAGPGTDAGGGGGGGCRCAVAGGRPGLDAGAAALLAGALAAFAGARRAARARRGAFPMV